MVCWVIDMKMVIRCRAWKGEIDLFKLLLARTEHHGKQPSEKSVLGSHVAKGMRQR